MQNPENTVTLSVDGLDYAGWKEVDITVGVEQQSRDFTLGITWRWPGSSESPARITHGAHCIVSIGDERVLTGYVYTTPIRYDANEITLGIGGRSLTSDLVDCSAERGQWRNQTIDRIITALAAPYGIRVVNQTGDKTLIADHQVEPGETVFESIDRLLEMSALLSTDDAYGQLVIARPGSGGQATDALVFGENILTASASLDFSSVYSEYECIGQRAGTDDTFGADASEVHSAVQDQRVRRRRLLTIQPGGQVSPAIALRRATWERESRMARALMAEYSVQGWRQSDGRLWRENTTVMIRDPLIGFEREMLIAKVRYSYSERGEVVWLSVAPREAFEPEPKERKPRTKGKGADEFEYLIPADWESR